MAKMFDGKLSSPCGDKLQSQMSATGKGGHNYRPLAGISCNASVGFVVCDWKIIVPLRG